MQTRRRRPLAPPWHPAALPPAGFCFEQDGGRFEAVQAVPHERSRFLNVWLVTWRTACAGCGAAVLTTSTAKTWEGLRRRRCQTCLTADLEARQAQRAADGTP